MKTLKGTYLAGSKCGGLQISDASSCCFRLKESNGVPVELLRLPEMYLH